MQRGLDRCSELVAVAAGGCGTNATLWSLCPVSCRTCLEPAGASCRSSSDCALGLFCATSMSTALILGFYELTYSSDQRR